MIIGPTGVTPLFFGLTIKLVNSGHFFIQINVCVLGEFATHRVELHFTYYISNGCFVGKKKKWC